MNELLKLAIDGHGGAAPGADRTVPRRNPDGTPARDSVSIAIDIADVTFR